MIMTEEQARLAKTARENFAEATAQAQAIADQKPPAPLEPVTQKNIDYAALVALHMGVIARNLLASPPFLATASARILVNLLAPGTWPATDAHGNEVMAQIRAGKIRRSRQPDVSHDPINIKEAFRAVLMCQEAVEIAQAESHKEAVLVALGFLRAWVRVFDPCGTVEPTMADAEQVALQVLAFAQGARKQRQAVR